MTVIGQAADVDPNQVDGQELSDRRARVCRDRLVALGVPAAVFADVRGVADTAPRLDSFVDGRFNDSLAALNRRVDIVAEAIEQQGLQGKEISMTAIDDRSQDRHHEISHLPVPPARRSTSAPVVKIPQAGPLLLVAVQHAVPASAAGERQRNSRGAEPDRAAATPAGFVGDGTQRPQPDAVSHRRADRRRHKGVARADRRQDRDKVEEFNTLMRDEERLSGEPLVGPHGESVSTFMAQQRHDELDDTIAEASRSGVTKHRRIPPRQRKIVERLVWLDLPLFIYFMVSSLNVSVTTFWQTPGGWIRMIFATVFGLFATIAVGSRPEVPRLGPPRLQR